MSDLRKVLVGRFAAALRQVVGEEHAGADPQLRRSDRADWQADVALALAKKVGKPPRELAAAILEKLDVSDLCEKVEIAGPGFLNLTLSASYLAREVRALGAPGGAHGVTPATKPDTVVIDYSSPNVAKEMHVGHLRSTVIGDSLARTLEALGHRVIRQNHLGDWGTPFGMLIEHLLDMGGDPAMAASSISDLDGFYRAARAKFDGDEAFAERSRKRVVSLQGGDGATLALWRVLVDTSKRYFGTVYAKLGITLKDADVRGESAYNDDLARVVTELEEKGLTTIDDGAVCLFLEGFTNKEGDPLPLIVRKSDGGFGYAATDLAAVRYRTGALGATRLLYVVGAPQQQHFAMVFAAAKKAGWLTDAVRAEHVMFGSVLGPDKKMFKTRSGETVKLAELASEAIELAERAIAEKNPELEAAERAEVARMIGIGAIKYVDLSSDRVKDYVFDWSRMLAFEGNTAPYLQYAHARIQSILRRADASDLEASRSAELLVREAKEHALALELLGFGGVVTAVGESLQPHRLCTYLYGLATAFTQFYEACPVLKAEDAAVRRSRLALASVTAEVLAKGLSLLGIESPTRM